MGCASNKGQHGFTLVEISIVMIIIGLLIGGTFGGMKLIENMQVNKTVQDLKAIESAALTFRNTYGRLPGDMPNTATRLPNCTTAPCSTGGNGDRGIDRGTAFNAALAATNERFTFWHHLQAADILSIGTNNTTTLDFGEGQPNAPIGTGYRLASTNTPSGTCRTIEGGLITLGGVPSAALTGGTLECGLASSLDAKFDDGAPIGGRLTSTCITVVACSAPYATTGASLAIYDIAF